MTEPVSPALPTEGGSYIRHPDGRLERQVEPVPQKATPRTGKSTVKET